MQVLCVALWWFKVLMFLPVQVPSFAVKRLYLGRGNFDAEIEDRICIFLVYEAL